MSIDLEAIEARANAATPGKWEAKTNRHPECSGEAWGWIDGPVENWCWTDRRAHSRADAEFIANAHQDIPALLAEVKRQAAEIAAVTAERDALKEALELMAEYIVTLGGVDYHLCDVIPQEHHLKYQPKNDGDYDNEPCIECVKAYFMSGAGKEQNDGK